MRCAWVVNTGNPCDRSRSNAGKPNNEMVILDTDVLTILVETPVEGTSLFRSRLAALPKGEVVTTIISYEEQTRGWLARIAKAKSVADQVEGYRRLRVHLDSYRRISVIDFDA